MKTVNQNVEIAFKAIDFSDALIMLPVMDKIVEDINNYQKAIDNNNQNDKENLWLVEEAEKKLPTLIKRYNLLSRLGFVSQIDFISTVKLS